jgi:hypothetical protein
MKYYTSTTQFNCRIDLHARQMYVCLMDRTGNKLIHTNVLGNDFAYFLRLIEPYRHDVRHSRSGEAHLRREHQGVKPLRLAVEALRRNSTGQSLNCSG